MAGYVYEIKKDQAFSFGGEGAVAMEDVSVPVEPLFNENDSCGEAVPQADVMVHYQRPDGTRGMYGFMRGENIILGHDEIKSV